jgi:hypothetical protein
MKDRMDLLEQTILDLGTEVYKLKHTLVSVSIKQHALQKVLEGLRGMLDEKGLITQEEVEESTLMNDLVEAKATPRDHEQEKLYTKKESGH